MSDSAYHNDRAAGRHAAYLFSVKGIQRFIFESGRRQDLVGASEIVARLASNTGGDTESPDDDLELVLKAIGAKCRISFSRRAGGVFMAHVDLGDDHGTDADSRRRSGLSLLYRLRALFRLHMFENAPGLEFADAIAFGDTPRAAGEAAYNQATTRMNSVASVPPFGSPLTDYAPRTGRPAVAKVTRGDHEELIDRIVQSQRNAAIRLKSNLDAVSKRFLPSACDLPKDRATRDYAFPRNLSEAKHDMLENELFPFEGARGEELEKQWIAVVHADISGLGKIWTAASAASGVGEGSEALSNKDLIDLSTQIENVIEGAAKAASAKWLFPNAVTRHYWRDTKRPADRSAQRDFDVESMERRFVVPARPIVLGGDDLTIIVRADLALAFATSLLEQFEEMSAKAFAEASGALEKLGAGLPKRLTAGAGVAFCKVSQPFDMASALAESLCKVAKNAAKKHAAENGHSEPASVIAFHAISTSVRSDRYQTLRDAELTSQRGGLLTLNPYFCGGLVDEQCLQPRIDDLFELHRAFSDDRLRVGGLRELPRLFALDAAEAERVWRRWREVHDGPREERRAGGGTEALNKVDAALNALGCKAENWFRDAPTSAGVIGAPIEDLITLMQLKAQAPESKRDAAPAEKGEADAA